MPGGFGDVVLGYDSVLEYLRGDEYFGATVGRYANRIAQRAIRLDGKWYELELNAPPNAEHGGERGLRSQIWTIEGTDIADGGRFEPFAGEPGRRSRLPWRAHRASHLHADERQ